MSDILTFIWAVINNWAGYSTGGLIVATAAFWAIWRDKPMPRTALLILSGLFLFMAIYKAWHDQKVTVTDANKTIEGLRKELDEARHTLDYEREQNTPKLSGEIDQMAIGDVPEMGGAQIFLQLSVRNTGAASIVEAWLLRVKTGSLDKTVSPLYVSEGFKLWGDNKREIAVFSRQDMFDEKAVKPIQRGDQIRGWLRYEFIGVKGSQLYLPEAEFVVTFKDVLGKEYSTPPYRVGDIGHEEKLGFFPGGGLPFHPDWAKRNKK